MRTIIKTIAQNGLSPINRCRCSKGIGHWLYGLFLLISLSGWTAVATAATPPNTELTNIATISYAIGGGAVMTKQATASITTTDRTPAQISFYSAFENGTPMQVPDTDYSTNPGSNSDWLNLQTGLPDTLNVSATSSFAPGETLLIRVEDFDQNIDPTVRESIIITLTTDSGDTETLRLLETTPNSGVFMGAVLTASGSGVSSPNGTLLVQGNTQITASYSDSEDTTDVAATAASIDPVSLVFDSTTGTPINNAKVILVHDKSGGAARVYDTDGTLWPSEVMSGENVASRSADKYQTGNGQFRFPRVPAGEYRLEVIPPPGYRYPSQQTDAHIKTLGSVSIKVKIGSRAERFMLEKELEAIEVNIPLDPFDGRFGVEKTVDQKIVSQGDVLEYTVTATNHDTRYPLSNVFLEDMLPPGFRYIAGSARYADGVLFPETMLAVDGRLLSFRLGNIESNVSTSISYQVRVGAGSPKDEAVNKIQGFSDDAVSNVARATVKLVDELMTEEGLLIGRVFTGSCDDPEQQQAVKNVRLYFENGRSVTTDERGRWHLAGVRPGTHVVQLDTESLGAGLAITEQCKLTARHAGSHYAQFVELREGNLWRVDFRLKRVAGAESAQQGKQSRMDIIKPENPLLQFDKNFAEQAQLGLEFVWPPARYVPGISSIKIAVKYPPQYKLKVLLNGDPVNPLNFEGSASNKAKTVAISRWTGVDINRKNNILTAIVTDKSGNEVQRTERIVHFTERSTSAELVEAESTLVADGKQRPVIAIRLEDDEGYTPRPRTHGSFTLEYPHWKPVQVKTAGVKLESEFSNGRYEYIVSNDGLVRIELEPTNRSGQVVFNMQLSDGNSAPVKAWLKPALRDWIMVGFVKGGIGYNTLSGNMQTLNDLGEEEGFYKKGQLSFFAKGRIRGDYLLTMAYDSEKQRGEVGEQLEGVIDSDKWYTLYGDDQTEQYEAPSQSKLYVKLEKQQFSALFGDYYTDMDVTELSNYQRVLHGLKSVYKGDNISYTAFASQSDSTHQRDEIRADGTSGLYRLSREPLANSEKIVIEVRDRDDTDVILNARTLTRYVDYEIDYADKSLFFKFPVSGSDDEFNPVIIAVDYESADSDGNKNITAGGRIAYTSDDNKMETGLTYLREGDGDGGQQVGVDWRYEATEQLELKAEMAQSDNDTSANAWLAEAEYQQDALKLRAYASEEEKGFGLGQKGQSGQSQRKLGVESSYALSEDSAVSLDSSYHTQPDEDTKRTQTHIKWQKQFEASQVDVGYRHTDESTAGERDKQTRQITLGGSTEVLDGKAVLSARLEKGLGGSDDKATPDRAKVGLDYKLSDKTTAFVEHERVMAEAGDLDNTRVGMKTTPWEGGRLHTGYVREREVGADASEYRDYATAGLSQQWKVNDKLTVDTSYDRMQTLQQSEKTSVAGDRLSVADNDADDDSGYLSGSDDYQAVSLGATWKEEDWTATGRVEYRNGDNEDKHSVLLGIAHEVDDQRTVSVQGRVVQTEYANGDLTQKSKLGLHLAARPDDKGNWFNRLEFSDETELRDGAETQTRKVINNIHYNRQLNKDTELSLHHGIKLNLTDKEMGRYRSLLDTMQAAVRFDVNDSWDVGVQGGYLHGWDSNTRSFFSGVAVGFSPDKNIRIEAGYNFSGFHDDDFDSGQYTHQGPYIDLNYRLDQQLIESLQERQ